MQLAANGAKYVRGVGSDQNMNRSAEFLENLKQNETLRPNSTLDLEIDSPRLNFQIHSSVQQKITSFGALE